MTIDGVGSGRHPRSASAAARDRADAASCAFRIRSGLLYSAFTYFTGFKVNSGEYKVMGLAPYGEPKYVKAIKRSSARHPRRRQPVDEHGVLHVSARADHDREQRSRGCSAGRHASPRASSRSAKWISRDRFRKSPKR